MYSKDDYKILQLRNETSLCLDDLVALVVNSALADQLRTFSGEVMDLTPGFTFTLKQAKMLKELTQKTFRQYKNHHISDVDLMNYQSQAQTVIKGETIEIGGNQVGFLDKIIHGKEIKRQEALDKLERDYRDVCTKIAASQEKMRRCVKEAEGHSPDSVVYRNNERIYTSEKNRLTLLTKQEAHLRKILIDKDQMLLIEELSRQQEEMANASDLIFGDGKAHAKMVAQYERREEILKENAENREGFGDSLFAKDDSSFAFSNSEFGAKVAEEERRKDLMNGAGMSFGEATSNAAGPKSEFDQIMSASSSREE